MPRGKAGPKSSRPSPGKTWEVWVDNRNLEDLRKGKLNTFFIVLMNPQGITTETAQHCTLTLSPHREGRKKRKS